MGMGQKPTTLILMMSSFLTTSLPHALAAPSGDPNVLAPVSPPPIQAPDSIHPEIKTAPLASPGATAVPMHLEIKTPIGTLRPDNAAARTGPVKAQPQSQPKKNTEQRTLGSASSPAKSVKNENLAKPESTPVFGPPGKAQAAPLPASAAASSGNAKPATTPPVVQSLSTGAPASSTAPKEDSYPSVGRMEKLTFGSSQAATPIEQRLGKLEMAIYRKSFPEISLFDRTQQLKKTLLGNDEEPTADLDNLRVPHSDWAERPMSTNADMSAEPDYYESLAQRPENQQRVTKEDLRLFAVEMINAERSKVGLGPLQSDELADKMAREHDDDLCRRNTISHANSSGDNPDRRYTLGGGTGALTESIVSNKTADTFSKMPTRASVIYLIKTIMSRQDDRDAIMNPDATDVGFAINWTPDKQRVVAVTEVVTNHGIIHAIPNDVHLGEKLEVKGVVTQPYKFDRVTIAWEANKNLGTAADESEEALPYFPPLDYVAYAGKSEHDYSTAIGALKTVGIIAAIAGGMFMPPVALAAPMIAMSGGMGNSEPKPASDIPVHGGVKVEGSTFIAKVPINKDGKEGIYYVTIWGATTKYAKSVPISRRAIIAKIFEEDVSAHIETPAEEKKQEKKEKKHTKDKQDKQ